MAERLEQVRQLLKAQLVEIEAEAGELRAALVKLDGSATSAPQKSRRRSKRRSAKRGRSGSRRVAKGQRQKQFLEAVVGNPKASVSEIAKLIGISAPQANSLARRLEAKGEVKRGKKGVRVVGKGGAK